MSSAEREIFKGRYPEAQCQPEKISGWTLLMRRDLIFIGARKQFLPPLGGENRGEGNQRDKPEEKICHRIVHRRHSHSSYL